MDRDIIDLLRLFHANAPDSESIGWVLSLAEDRNKWSGAGKLFEKIRHRNLAAIDAKDTARECQHCFEEVCLKSLYNETQPGAPFDSDSPHWISKNALDLARAIGVPIGAVVEILSPSSRFSK